MSERIALNPSSQDWADHGVNEGVVQHQIAYKVAAELRRRGHQTMVTESDHDLPAEVEQMRRFRPTKALALHNEGGSETAHTGFELIYHDAAGLAMARHLANYLRPAFPKDKVTLYRDVDICGHTLYVLSHADWPMCLLESLNANNPEDARRLESVAFQRQLVNALAMALVGRPTVYLRIGPFSHRNCFKHIVTLEKMHGKPYPARKIAYQPVGKGLEVVWFGPWGPATCKLFRRRLVSRGVPLGKLLIRRGKK